MTTEVYSKDIVEGTAAQTVAIGKVFVAIIGQIDSHVYVNTWKAVLR